MFSTTVTFAIDFRIELQPSRAQPRGGDQALDRRAEQRVLLRPGAGTNLENPCLALGKIAKTCRTVRSEECVLGANEAFFAAEGLLARCRCRLLGG